MNEELEHWDWDHLNRDVLRAGVKLVLDIKHAQMQLAGGGTAVETPGGH